MLPLNLYIHIPICKNKCPYCHFFSVKKNSINLNQYIKNLHKEFLHKQELFNLQKKTITSIYFGGGTPSLLNTEQIKSILENLKKSAKISPTVEITLEINPNHITTQKLQKFINIGVNRISFGIQTINSRLFTYHQRKNNLLHLNKLLKISENNNISYNLDFIYAWPEQNLKDLKKDLDFALNSKAQHLAFYELEIKPPTPIFFKQKKKPNIFPPENKIIKMRNLIEQTLKKENWEHYEISNWCKNKKYSQHNLNFWQNQEYLGLGLNASSYINQELIINNKDFTTYYQKKGSFHTEPLTKVENALQYIMKTLRFNQGLYFENLPQKIQKPISQFFKSLKPQYFKELSKEKVILSEKGWLKYDYLLSQINNIIYENISESKN